MRSAVVIAVVLMLGCGESWQGEGTVVGHSFDDADQWFIPPVHHPGGLRCSGGYGDVPRRCSHDAGWTSPGYWHYESERHLLEVQDSEGKNHSVEVSPSTYDACRKGDVFSTETQRCGPE